MAKYDVVDTGGDVTVIKVIGVGGGGSKAVNHMFSHGIKGVEFICANTDLQALKESKARTLAIGERVTKGLGAGMKPDIGREAALEDEDRIMELMTGVDMVFLAAGMGGGTGTGAAPIFAQLAKEAGALTVAVVTKPFEFEGHRMQLAEAGIEELRKHVDALITIPNDKILPVLGADIPQTRAFSVVNDVLLCAVKGLSEIITVRGDMNVDFSDVRTIMAEGKGGIAIMGSGKAQGEERAIVAMKSALSNPLLEDENLEGAKAALVNVTAGEDMSMGEFNEIFCMARELICEDAKMIPGHVNDPEMNGEVQVTIIFTGLERNIPDRPSADKGYATPTAVPQQRVDRKHPKNDLKNLDTPSVLRLQAD